MADTSRRGPTYYIHIGLPKTGTSFLQSMLAEHRKTLKGRGVLYPDDGSKNHFLAALDLRGNHKFGGAVRPAEGRWRAMVKQTAGYDGIVLISHEILSMARAEQLAEGMRLLEDRDVHLIVTLRDPARQIVAEWQEGIKHGHRHTFKTFMKRSGLDDDDPTQPSSRLFDAQRIDHVLENWTSYVPDERIHVVTVPPSGGDPRMLWDRYCSVLGVDGSDLGADEARNVSLGVAQIEALRRVNVALDGRIPQPAYGKFVKRLYAGRVLGTTAPSAKPVLPPQFIDRAATLAKHWTTYLESRSFDVIGDIAELTPVVAEGSHPGDWTEEAVADIGAQATAELLVELRDRSEQGWTKGAPASLARGLASKIQRSS